MARLRAPESQLLADSGATRALRSQPNRAVVTPATSTALPITSKGGARTVVFDHLQSFVVPRRRRSRLGWFSFVIVIAVPVLAAAYYYFFVAATNMLLNFVLLSAPPNQSAMTQPYSSRNALGLRRLEWIRMWSCNISSARACPPTGLSPRASANSSRSIRAKAMRPMPRTAVSN